MATVEQCETQPSGLGTLSSTLDLFDSYKPLQEEEKDSDEESFHLPMLDCDDDLESNSKEEVTSEVDKDTHDETEDDILNKFATTATPDLDPKIEDSILEDIEELCKKKPSEESINVNNSEKESSQKECVDDDKEIETPKGVTCTEEVEKEKSVISDKNSDSTATEESLGEIKDTTEENVADEKEKDTDEQQENEKVVEDLKIIEQDDMDDDSKQVNSDLDKDNTDNTETKKCSENCTNIVDESIENNIEVELPVENNLDSKNKNEEIGVNSETDSMIEEANSKIIEVTNDDKILNTEAKDTNAEQESMPITEIVEAVEENQETVDVNTMEEMDVDSVEPETRHSEINISLEKQENATTEFENTDKNNDQTTVLPETKDKPEAMDIEVPPSNKDKDQKEDSITASKNIETADNKDKESDKESITDEVFIAEKTSKDSTPCETIDENKLLEECNSSSSNESNKKEPDATNPLESTTLDQSVTEKDAPVADESKADKIEPEKCENSNDSSKSQNLECDDLLDISIIRDADEDNASAIAENANDARSSEKSDNDDQDEGSEKAENDLDESEMDQEESLLTTDKDDNMDFEDGNSSNLCEQDNTISGNTSDSENKDDVDMRDSENESKDSSSVLKEKTNKSDKNKLDSEKRQTDKPKDVNSQTPVVENQDSVKENAVKVSGKRSLSDSEKDTITKKKIKLSECASTEEKKKSPAKNNKVKTLITFEKYMQNKKLNNKLSRSDLEQFCLQKICEAIVHKTDVGELHQTIKKQELIIENLRKDLQQLTKQTRDLDIVNKKLMNELRAQNGSKKPLVPLKITRSVGLQVKLNLSPENTIRRKMPVSTTTRPTNTPNTPNTPVRPRTITPANTGVVRQVAASPRKTPTTTPTSTPLLSQALQNRQASSPANNTVKRTPIRPKPAEPQKPANQSVIDLTDEDDKAAKKVVGTPVKILNKTAIPLSQAKTLNIVPAKTVPNKTINSNQSKTVAVGQVKTTTVGAKVGTSTRTVTTLPQGVRLTPTQVKNGSITLPASVVTSNSGTTQLMYVVQPTSSLGQVVTTTAGGAQKAVLLNFQPTNGVLTSALNGSAVSVIPTKTTNTVQLKTVAAPRKHPAPLPTPPTVAANASLKPLLPKPHLSIRKTDTGIILQWRMPYNLEIYEGIASYQLFAYQETNAAPSTDMWRKVGDVKALALPMACTLTQFADKNKYYFAVRSVDVHKRIGAFSDPEEISL